MTCMQTAYIP